MPVNSRLRSKWPLQELLSLAEKHCEQVEEKGSPNLIAGLPGTRLLLVHRSELQMEISA